MTGTVRWGILGTAKIARDHVAPAIAAAPNAELVAVASRDRSKAESFGAEFSIPEVYGDYEALLASANVDAVYIPLPNHLHGEWTMAAAAAGKHVLCEKPMAMNAAEARQVVDACRAAGVVFMEAFMYRLHPAWEKVRELVADGRIGRVRSIQSWFSYFSDDPHNIRHVVEFGGGALMDIGCYPINVSRMIYGREPTAVSSVMVKHPVFGVDILTSAMLEFGDDVATFTCSTMTAPDQRVSIYGSDGHIALTPPFNLPKNRPVHVILTTGNGSEGEPVTESIPVPAVDEYAVEIEMFSTAVLRGEPVPIPPEDGIANMAVIDLLFDAAQ